MLLAKITTIPHIISKILPIKIFSMVIVSTAIIFMPNLANAALLNAVWNGGTGNWNDASNWSTANFPNNGVDTYNVFIDSGNAAASVATLNTTVTINDLTIDSPDQLDINAGQTLTLTSGSTLSNDGTLDINTFTFGNTTLRLSGAGNVDFIGNGTLIMSDVQARIIGTNSGEKLTIQDMTIEGAGAIGGGTMELELQSGAEINANLSGKTMTIDPDSNGVTNAGLIRSTNGGQVTFSSGDIDNTGGTVRAENSSTVRLQSNADLSGGTIETSGSGVIELSGGDVTGGNLTTFNIATGGFLDLFSSSTIDADFTIASGASADINSAANITLANDATIVGQLNLTGTSFSTSLEIDGPVTLDGGGIIDMTSSTVNRIDGINSPVLTNTDVTIQGRGTLGGGTLQLNNGASGIIDANVSGGTLTFDPDANVSTNSGIMRATNGGQLTFSSGTLDNTGGDIQAQNASTIRFQSGHDVSGGDITTSGTGEIELSGATISGGALSTNLTINSGGTLRMAGGTNFIEANTVINNGGIGISNNATTVTFQDDVVINSGASYEMQGTSSSTTVTIDGAVDFSGGGEFIMDSSAVNRITGTGVSPTLTNSGVEFKGRGTFGNNSLEIVNLAGGTITANVNNATYTLDPNANGITNSGLINATNGGILVLSSGSIDNTGGTIRPENDSIVRVQSNGQISGGSILTSGTGEFQFSSGGVSGGGATNFTIGSDGTMRVTTNSTSNILNANAQIDGTGISNNATTLILQGDLVISSGASYEMQGTSFSTQFLIDGTIEMSGGGTFDMTSSTVNRITGNGAGTHQLTNSGIEFFGRGVIGNNSMEIINAVGGEIRAEVGTLTLDPNASGMTNTGTLSAANSGLLRLNGGTYDNTGGLIQARDTGTIQFGGSSFINNGDIETVDTGVIEFNGGVFTGGSGANISTGLNGSIDVVGSSTNSIDANLTNLGTVNINNATDLTLVAGTGTISNQGTININTTSFTTELLVSGGEVFIGGGGNIVMTNSTANRIDDVSGGSLRTNNTISGAGTIAANLTLDAGGVINATESSGINFNGATAHVNNGTFQVSSGSQMLINDPISGSGEWIVNGGLLDVNQAVTTTGDITVNNGGTLRLDADFSGDNLIFDSTSVIDVNTGTLTLSGDFIYSITDEADWEWSSGTVLEMTGSVIELAGEDLGTDPANHVGDPAGFVGNFSLQELVISGNLVLVDNIDNGNRIDNGFGSNEALYVDTLTFANPGATLNLNGLHIYFNTLNGDSSQIIDVQAVNEPRTLWMLVVMLAALLLLQHVGRIKRA